jgi:hypothetical protein
MVRGANLCHQNAADKHSRVQSHTHAELFLIPKLTCLEAAQ